jgi:hypothetical protein
MNLAFVFSIGYFVARFLQRLVDLGFGKGGLGAKERLLALLLLALNLRQ